MIRERPILFSDAMVKAILEGRKTQTRRILNPQPVECEKGLSWHTRQKEVRLGGGGLGVCGGADSAWRAEEVKRFAAQRCAYGSPGDRLYVRETFSGPHEWTDIPPAGWGWDGSHVPIWYWADGNPECGDWTRPKPGIHLPKRYSRITLEITDVRVQRLQEISEDDARAEGITDGGCTECGNSEPCGCANPSPDARDAFCWLWNSINAKRAPWDSNPWVWAISFKRITA
jgi:hypothetical protein